MDVMNSKRIVLLGKYGVGKSSLANTILEEDDVFNINHYADSETQTCQAETRSVNGRSITLIDTPGFFDTDRSEKKLKPEIVRCITECAPGPHAFLILLKVEKHTEHEEAVIKKITECFSEEMFKYATVVFTHGDELPKGVKIQKFIDGNEGLKDLVKKCGGRCHVVDNKYWNKDQEEKYRSNRFQVAEILNTVDKMVKKNNGGYYTNEMLQRAEEEIQQEEKSIGQSSGNMSDQEIREKAKKSVFEELLIRSAGTATGGPSRCDSGNPRNTMNSKRIVLLGKTGAGKSSLANMIFEEDDVFNINHSADSETKKCQAETRSGKGRSITLIDTPGFFDTRKSEELKPAIVRCITECASGTHAFLILLKVEKYTEQEEDIIKKITEYFSEEAFKYAAVVFTHGDQLPKGTEIQKFIGKNESLKDLLKKCGGRCHVVDNKYWNKDQEKEYRSNRFQVAEILNTVDKMVKENNGDCYTNEMLQIVEEEIQQEEKSIRQSSGNMSDQEIREKAKKSVFKKLLIRFAGTATGALLGALFGVVVMVGAVATALRESSKPVSLQQATAMTVETAVGTGIPAAVGAVAGVTAGAPAVAGAVVAGTAVGVSAVIGAVRGGMLGDEAAKEAASLGEAVEKATKAVKEEAQRWLDKTAEVFLKE